MGRDDAFDERFDLLVGLGELALERFAAISGQLQAHGPQIAKHGERGLE
ncbi:MAG: hypothetical protein ACFB2Z_04205 [Maricaulaceae bacterium]